MVSRVLYRPFDTEDFDAIALILQQLWHNNSDNDEYNRLEAACDLAYCLSSSTFSQVAVIDGEARGIALARAGQNSGVTINEHWMDTERALLSQMRELEPDACAEYLSFVRATIRQPPAREQPVAARQRGHAAGRGSRRPWPGRWHGSARCRGLAPVLAWSDEGAPVHRLQLLVEVLRAARL